MSIKAMFGYVWVKPQKVEHKTASGLFMPTDSEDKMSYGVVYSSSVDGINEGDTIVYQKGRGTETMYCGENYVILVESNIFGVVE